MTRCSCDRLHGPQSPSVCLAFQGTSQLYCPNCAAAQCWVASLCGCQGKLVTWCACLHLNETADFIPGAFGALLENSCDMNSTVSLPVPFQPTLRNLDYYSFLNDFYCHYFPLYSFICESFSPFSAFLLFPFSLSATVFPCIITII